MRLKRLPNEMTVVLALISAVLLATGTRAAAQTENVILSFDASDGSLPIAGLTVDAAGNLYGAVEGGGPDGMGLIFELIPKAGGGWTWKVLHVFKNDGKDGNNPWGTLVFDAAGNLYGTTANGGPYTATCQPPLGCGTVFELMPTASGFWLEKILHNFNINDHDGYFPVAGVVFDSAGNLYGTTALGGNTGCNAPDGCGTVFELMPKTTGLWTEKVLHSFDRFADGEGPRDSLILDPTGNLYGTTYAGGPGQGYGTVFELTPPPAGTSAWTYTLLYTFHQFQGTGILPNAGLIRDAAGNLYGTTRGGSPEPTTVFELVLEPEGNFAFKVLSKFQGKGNAINILGGLVLDPAGNLYGTSSIGGVNTNCGSAPQTSCGTVFELSPEAGGVWAEKVLHSFSGNRKDGFWPQDSLILDAAGNLYGTTMNGGDGNCKINPVFGCGTVFEVTP